MTCMWAGVLTEAIHERISESRLSKLHGSSSSSLMANSETDSIRNISEVALIKVTINLDQNSLKL